MKNFLSFRRSDTAYLWFLFPVVACGLMLWWIKGELIENTLVTPGTIPFFIEYYQQYVVSFSVAVGLFFLALSLDISLFRRTQLEKNEMTWAKRIPFWFLSVPLLVNTFLLFTMHSTFRERDWVPGAWASSIAMSGFCIAIVMVVLNKYFAIDDWENQSTVDMFVVPVISIGAAVLWRNFWWPLEILTWISYVGFFGYGVVRIVFFADGITQARVRVASLFVLACVMSTLFLMMIPLNATPPKFPYVSVYYTVVREHTEQYPYYMNDTIHGTELLKSGYHRDQDTFYVNATYRKPILASYLSVSPNQKEELSGKDTLIDIIKNTLPAKIFIDAKAAKDSVIFEIQ